VPNVMGGEFPAICNGVTPSITPAVEQDAIRFKVKPCADV